MMRKAVKSNIVFPRKIRRKVNEFGEMSYKFLMGFE